MLPNAKDMARGHDAEPAVADPPDIAPNLIAPGFRYGAEQFHRVGSLALYVVMLIPDAEILYPPGYGVAAGDFHVNRTAGRMADKGITHKVPIGRSFFGGIARMEGKKSMPSLHIVLQFLYPHLGDAVLEPDTVIGAGKDVSLTVDNGRVAFQHFGIKNILGVTDKIKGVGIGFDTPETPLNDLPGVPKIIA
jgi:hypothetical protein